MVEDEDDARELYACVLEPRFARVSFATSATDALTLIEADKPDLIISDIALPEEDGYSFIRRLRALPEERGGKIPALALTAFARAQDKALAFEAGFDEHVAKPVEFVKLFEALSRLAQRTNAS